MKILLVVLTITQLSTCQNRNNMKADLAAVLGSKKKLDVYNIQYSPTDSSFYKGYGMLGKRRLDHTQIEKLLSCLKDSANYLMDRNKGCVLAANYGAKVKNDSNDYVIFIGKDPCLKLMVLDRLTNEEVVSDLSDENTIVPFFDTLFAAK